MIAGNFFISAKKIPSDIVMECFKIHKLYIIMIKQIISCNNEVRKEIINLCNNPFSKNNSGNIMDLNEGEGGAHIWSYSSKLGTCQKKSKP